MGGVGLGVGKIGLHVEVHLVSGCPPFASTHLPTFVSQLYKGAGVGGLGVGLGVGGVGGGVGDGVGSRQAIWQLFRSTPCSLSTTHLFERHTYFSAGVGGGVGTGGVGGVVGAGAGVGTHAFTCP